MGKNARNKKQAKIEKLLDEKQQIEQRKVIARSPLVNSVKHFSLVLIVTFILLYIGQAVTQRITSIESRIEVTK